MKKIAVVSLLTTFLGACSSPPDPAPFPKTRDSNLNPLIVRDRSPSVPLNRFDLPEWYFSIITHGALLNESQKNRFWYLAHHATDIEIVGDYNHANELKQLMISNGVTAKIIINSQYPNSSTLSVNFAKIKSQAHNQGATL